jgi:putative addiction module component (TIGR02574 family)
MGRTIPHMTERCIELLQQAWSLTAEERADLTASLSDRLEASPDPEAESAWQQEISQRAADLDSGAGGTIPWRAAQSKVSSALKHGPVER